MTKMIHRITRATIKNENHSFLLVPLETFKGLLDVELDICRIKADPLSYVDDDDEIIANFARALVS